MRSFALAFLVILFSCKPPAKGPAVIRDFRPGLQPLLVHVVTKGYADEVDVDSLARHAFRLELECLSRSEHPLLRAVACLALLQRKDVNHLAVINGHLDDTALISVDRGEWGLNWKMVSDELLYQARWKTEADRWITTDSVFFRHDNLEAAYFASSIVDVRPKYYPFIKEMAQRKGEQIEFERKERTFYGLAKFQKKEDIPLIRDLLLANYHSLGYSSLRLMEEFPDSAYWDVFQSLYPRWFNRKLCGKDGYSEAATKFFDALASYRSDSSARLLTTILHRKPFCRCQCDSNYYRDHLRQAIWNNPCPAYLALRKEIEPAVREQERKYREDSIAFGYSPATVLQPKPTDESVRWW